MSWRGGLTLDDKSKALGLSLSEAFKILYCLDLTTPSHDGILFGWRHPSKPFHSLFGFDAGLWVH